MQEFKKLISKNIIFNKTHKKLIADNIYEKIQEDGFYLFQPNKKFYKWMNTDLKQLRELFNKLIINEGSKGGWEGREEYYDKGKNFEKGCWRLGNLPDKSDSMIKFSTIPELLLCANNIINDDICISSSNFRQTLHKTKRQKIHIDWLPKNKMNNYECVIAMFYLYDSNENNGGTIVFPGTHKIQGWPDEHINVHKNTKKFKKKIIKAKSGSILLFNSNLWHCGGANKSGAKRAVFNVIYRKRLLPQGLNQKKYLSNKTKNKMNALEQYLYRIRKNDKNQKVKIYGPGKDYRDFLIKNPKFQYNVTPT